MPAAKNRKAFTLVELLVVIGVIAVLIGILMPALTAAKRAAMMTQCGSNLRQVGMAMGLYLQESRGKFPFHPNGGVWTDVTGKMLLSDDDHAYWGVLYLPYLLKNTGEYERLAQGTGNQDALAWARTLWQCPASKVTDVDPGYSENNVVSLSATYGLNDLISARRTIQFRNSSEQIICHDAWEHKLEGNAGGDWLMAYSVIDNNLVTGITLKRENGNLLQYMSMPYAKIMRYEYYRHKHQSNVLWLDGHVSPIPESDGRDIPYQWYAGIDSVQAL
jgi:prepilin-type processing-associated H-X9-DG protein/prepilin-type N-terminal cleavage/methylation domain-containing protein